MSRLITVLTASVLLPLATLSAQQQPDWSPTPSQNSSQTQDGSSRKKLELSLGWWVPHPMARVSIGWYLDPLVELEPNFVVGSEDVVYSLNISANFSESGPEPYRLVPYMTAGFGVCRHGTPILNGGFGLKMRLGQQWRDWDLKGIARISLS